MKDKVKLIKAVNIIHGVCEENMNLWDGWMEEKREDK